MYIAQSITDRIIPVNDRDEINRRLLACLIKPFETADWWDKILSISFDNFI